MLINQLQHIVFRSLLLCLSFIISIQVVYAEATEKQLAANFTLKSQHDKNIKLTELRGQVIMLSFWATWCGNCIQQFPVLNQYYKKNKNRGFRLLAINIDEDSVKAKRFTQKRKFNYPVLFDSQNQISMLYSIPDIPVVILIDRDGYIRHTLESNQIKQQKITQQLIKDLLNE